MPEPPSQGLRTYYLLVATQTVSQIGSRISFFAVGTLGQIARSASQGTDLMLFVFPE